MNRIGIYLAGLILLAGVVSCNRGKKAPTTRTSGTIHISADESFKSLIDTEIAVFENLHPDAHIIPKYTSETQCFKDLIDSSAELIIVTRPLSKDEEAYFNKIEISMAQKKFARDGVALIVNPANKDSLMTMKNLKDIMLGKDTVKNYEVVFSIANSSLVHYVKDSVLEGKEFGEDIKTAGGSEEVVDYVASHENALGVIGAGWISNPYDSTGLSFLDKIKVIALMGDSTHNYLEESGSFDPDDPAYRKYYFKPYQAYIAFKTYPLTRNVYFVLRQPYFGLGTGFANFLTGNKGQLIIYKQRLFPLKFNYQIRKANLH
ncbi:MAG TPA: substrate-binding domain-containing protein [Chitinophagaceae bacterium]|nr:substrate-binding domain-containing protein [Chitinophagaceae bacterium]